MEDIEKEISEKVIEKSPQLVIHETPQPQPQPVKKPRSEAQKKAFEKARAKRLENLKVKAEEKKVQIAQPEASEIPSAPKRRGRPKGSKTKKVMKDLEPEPIPNYPQPIQHQPYEPRYHNIPFAQQNPMPYFNYQPPLPQAPQPVNNYYYYGAPPPDKVIDTTQQHLAPQPQPKEEEDEDISSDEEEHEVVLEPSNRVLKYRFA